jgi:hypothetical protein
MALGSTQPLTEMSTMNLSGGRGRLARQADNLTAICDPIRANLSDEHLKSLLVISVSRFEPQFNQILRMQKEFHHSH